MPRAWRWRELRLLIPVLILVPLGFAVTHVAQTNRLDPGPLWLAFGYLALVLAAHIVLAARATGETSSSCRSPRRSAGSAW